MLIFGIMMTTLGAILPAFIEKFGLNKIDAGSLLLLMSFGMMVGSLIFGPVVDRYGYKGFMAVCTAVIFICLEGIALASNLMLLRAAIFFLGIAGGIINGGTNALVADISEEGRSAGLSLLGVFFGLGAFGVPFLLGTLQALFSHATIVAGIGFIVLVPFFFFLTLRFPKPKQAQEFSITQGLGLVKETTLIIFGLMLFFESGMEITMGGWSATFFHEALAVESDNAVLFLSFYWLGMMCARLMLGRLLKRLSPATVLRICLATAFVGALLMLFTYSQTVATLGLILVGVGFAAGFPVVLGYVSEQYAKLSGTAFSLVLVIALMGGMTLPYLTGMLANSFGLRASLVIVPLSLVCMFFLLWLAQRRLKAKTMPEGVGA